MMTNNPNCLVSTQGLKHLAELIINHCNFTSTTAILPLIEVHGTVTKCKSETLIGCIRISLAAAASELNQSLKYPNHTISTMETKLTVFLQAKAHQTMAGAPVFTPFIKLDCIAINGTGES